jgi:hypothetical protein
LPFTGGFSREHLIQRVTRLGTPNGNLVRSRLDLEALALSQMQLAGDIPP